MISPTRWRFIALSLLCAMTSAELGAQRPQELINKRIIGKVVSVIDGDTVDLLVAPKRVLRVRLHGIDTPEREEPFNTQARNFTRVLMFSRDVEAVGKDVDAYGRLVARVSVDGTDTSAAILAAGLGCTYHRYVSDPGLDMAQARARDSRVGFWATGAQQPPCVAREKKAIVRPRD
jgi:endonuclease YncB( thermonuclease family)